MSMLEVSNLGFYYNLEKIVLKDISFAVGRGDILCLLGPNGTGKTTLLRCLLAINRPQKGTIRINGTDITKTTTKKGRNIWPMCRKRFPWPFLIKEEKW